MLRILKKIRNFLAYALAALVILLAVMVGLFRLFLPRLTEYQADIKSWATTAIGMQVEFTGMNARWRLSGPELNFYDAELTRPGDDDSLIEAAEVTIGVALLRLLIDRTLVVDRVLVRDTELDFRQGEEGTILVQGLRLDDLAEMIPTSGDAGDVVLVGEDIELSYRPTGDVEMLHVDVESVEAVRRDDALSVQASLDLEDGFGSRLDVTADQLVRGGEEAPIWQLYAEGRSIGIARWSALLPDDIAPVVNGFGDVSLWLEIGGDGLRKATANVVVEDFGILGAEPGDFFDLQGRFEFSAVGSGLLVAAENFSLTTAAGRWPASSLQLQLVRGDDAGLRELSASASYADLEDLGYFTPWLPDEVVSALREFQPTGQLSDLRVNVTSLDSGAPRFDVAADAVEVGVRPVHPWPGVSGFTGGLRADAAGGRLEFQASGMRIDLPQYLNETVVLDDAIGNVIWRRSDEGLIVLTDRMRLRSTDFDSRTSLQVTVPADGGSPVVDLDSRWSINDVSSAKRFLPEPVIHPALYRWLTTAIVSGTMTSGTTRLVGPLDRFPYDEGGGRFEVRARFEDGVLDYARGWPAASIRSMDIRLDGLRLSTERNLAFTAGNRTEDARVEIADLRKPLLTIDAEASGTLQTIREFVVQSPISRLFGGRLDGVRVAGDASFTLDLDYPITDRENYSFETRIRPDNGTFELLGFPAVVSNLAGAVSITRETLSADGLTGSFLGHAVDIGLRRAGDDEPSYSVVAEARGSVGTDDLVEGLGAPLAGLMRGETEYSTTIHFPRAGLPQPVPVTLDISSDLRGIGLTLPPPVAKPEDARLPLSLSIEFPVDREIVARGALGDDIRWHSNFYRDDDGWDFDRGSLTFGGADPQTAELRGLHISGETALVRLSEWLSVARNGGGDGPRFTDRIRSIDLTIDDLYLFGQHLEDQRVTVDRSGAEWIVQAFGEQVAGTVTLPYDLSGERPITLDMDTLVLPGDDAADAESGVREFDPRQLPAISIAAREFAIGERYFGALKADFERDAEGLRADALEIRSEAFRIDGSAGWTVAAAPGSLPGTELNLRLVSDDVRGTLASLAYDPVIDSEQMNVDVDVNWPGGPRGDFIADVSGEVRVRFGPGQLDEVEPGAGRVFGLMSIVALPRRLSLDFRDVFDKGLGFDEITGTFQLDSGDAYTCDLSLKGPAADIGVVGRVGLGEGVYDQTALVSANVGNTLPVVGAVVAGPQVAAALLIFSQIFKKPLQEMGQVYYAIDGSLEDPTVEEADAQRFAASSQAANCVAAIDKQ